MLNFKNTSQYFDRKVKFEVQLIAKDGTQSVVYLRFRRNYLIPNPPANE
jgi:hypothetical protein